MKKKLFAMAVALLATLSASAQILYKVSGGKLAKPSYVVGTFHLADASFAQKIPGVKEALDATDQVCGELKWDDLLNPDSLRQMQSYMMLPEGKTLEGVLGKATYGKLSEYLKTVMGAGLDNPIVAQQMGRLSPAVLSTQLQLLQYVSKHMGEFDPTNTIDSYFQTQAKANNEPISGLETIRFQCGVLYGSATLERQKTLLDCFLDNRAYYDDLYDRMAKAYFAQDLDALEKIVDEKFNATCDATPEEQDILIYRRNADWIKKMPAIMTAKPTLFVVGAGHLPGDKGLLHMLKAAGYTVEAVK